MKRILHIACLVILCLLAFCDNANAARGAANIIKYRQPDGSVILLKMYGDEFFGYAKTLDGYIVARAADGYFHYANYNSGSFSITSEIVNGCNSNTKSGDNAYVRSKEIPWATAMDMRNKAFRHINGNGKEADFVLENSPQIYQFSNAMEQEEEESKEIKVPVLLVQFKDLGFSIQDAKGYFNNMLNQHGYSNDGATGSAADYLNANFGSSYNFTFEVSDVITLTESVEFYGGRTEFLADANMPEMVIEACNAASLSGVDFSRYDLDGDGNVDNVAIIFAGCNEAESANSSLIWPHKGDVSNKRIELNGVKIASYSCSSELSGSEEEPKPASIGIFCHEYLHSWGLPDFYDVNDSNEGLSNALYGTLSIMDRGYYSNSGKTPPYFTSIEREMLDLNPVEDIERERGYTLLPIPQSDVIYRIPTSNDGEYFLLECRNQTGWDSYIGGEGLLVYHIDRSEALCGGMSAFKRWEVNAVNSFAPHECARVLAANPLVLQNGSLDGVFYPGEFSVTSLAATGFPKLADWQQLGLGVSITDISYNKESVTFNVASGIAFTETLPVATSVKTTPYQQSVVIEWKLPDSFSDAKNALQKKDGVWHISLLQKDTVLAPIELQSEELYCVAEALDMGAGYSGSIYFASADSMSRVSTFSVATDNITSAYPHLKLSGKYKKGAIVYMNVQNLEEKHNSVTIKLNGKLLEDNYYCFKEPGEYLVEVSILYPDRSSDIITKRIIVE